MLVSHQKKFIFTKTIKTGSTSIEGYFEKYCMSEGEWSLVHHRDEYQSEIGIVGFRGKLESKKKWYNHMPAELIKMQLGDETWNSYLKFCTIRNPYEKALSAFFHFVIHRNNIIEEKTKMIKRFRDWVRSGKGIMLDRNKYTINGIVCMDYFIRYEHLLKDLKAVCLLLNIPYEPTRLPNFKSGIRPSESNINEYYDNATCSVINRIYAFEFDYFNYTKKTV